MSKFILFVFIIYKGRALINNENWTLESQIINQNLQDLEEVVDLSKASNFSVAIELATSYTDIYTNLTHYEAYVKSISDLTTIHGYSISMNGFEEYRTRPIGEEFKYPNGRYESVFEQKLPSNLTKNSHGMYEFLLDLSTS